MNFRTPNDFSLTWLPTIAFSVVALMPSAAQTQSDKFPADTPLTAGAPTAVRALVSYSSVAINRDGKPLTGKAQITFLIYKDEQGGSRCSRKPRRLRLAPLQDIKIQLGASRSSGLPLDVFSSGEARWLEVQVEGRAIRARVLLASVPYALKLADAATLGGLPADAFMLAAQANNMARFIPMLSMSSSASTRNPSAGLVT